MPKIDDPFLKDYYRALFKGKPGTGKSIMAASWPGCYIFDLETRIRSVIQFWGKRGRKDISFGSFQGDFPGMNTQMDLLISHNPFDCIIIDTLTSFVDLVLGQVKRVKKEENEKAKKSLRDRRFVGGIEVNTISNYGAEAAALDDLIEWIRLLKCNVILVAHLVVVDMVDLEGNTRTERSLFTGGKKIAEKLPAYFNEAYQFEVGHPYENEKKVWTADYKIQTKSIGLDWAKTVLDIPMYVQIKDGDLYGTLKQPMKDAGYIIKEAA